jgi:hypothetical protein
MKRQKGGTVSQEQKDWALYLQGMGHKVFICKGAEDAKDKIRGIKNEET